MGRNESSTYKEFLNWFIFVNLWLFFFLPISFIYKDKPINELGFFDIFILIVFLFSSAILAYKVLNTILIIEELKHDKKRNR